MLRKLRSQAGAYRMCLVVGIVGFAGCGLVGCGADGSDPAETETIDQLTSALVCETNLAEYDAMRTLNGTSCPGTGCYYSISETYGGTCVNRWVVDYNNTTGRLKFTADYWESLPTTQAACEDASVGFRLNGAYWNGSQYVWSSDLFVDYVNGEWNGSYCVMHTLSAIEPTLTAWDIYTKFRVQAYALRGTYRTVLVTGGTL
jgi:hypothetical protein